VLLPIGNSTYISCAYGLAITMAYDVAISHANVQGISVSYEPAINLAYDLAISCSDG
jgi:hypothetical protein